MRTLTLVLGLGFVLSAAAAHGQVPVRRCLKDNLGTPMCAPAAGSIEIGEFSKLVCGRGQCLKDRFGAYLCSKEPGGVATTDRFNEVLCTGGCEKATPELCVKPTR